MYYLPCTCKKYMNDPHRLGCPHFVQKPAADVVKPVMMGPCTCGTQKVGGLCADYCDSKRTLEEYNQLYVEHVQAQKVPVSGTPGQVYYVARYDWRNRSLDLSDTLGGRVTMPSIPRAKVQHVDPTQPVMPNAPVVFR